MNILKARVFVVALFAAAVVAAGCNQSEQTANAVPEKKPVPSASATMTELPAGHPKLDAGALELPAGHPPVGGHGLPEGHPPTDMSTQKLPTGAVPEAGNPQWTVPKDWMEGKASAVRRGSFLAVGAEGQSADVAVTVFSGDVGGMHSNINRWRSQIGLAPVAAEEADKLVTKLDVNGVAAALVDFTGEKPPAGKTHAQRMLVVTIPHGGNSWFFKMTGDAPLVKAQKGNFLAFVKSVKF
jgi:hypothetical protein